MSSMFLNMVWKTFHDKYGNYPLRPIPPSHSNLLLTVMKLLENPFVPTTDCYSICQNRAGLRLGESITCMKKEAENTGQVPPAQVVKPAAQGHDQHADWGSSAYAPSVAPFLIDQ